MTDPILVIGATGRHGNTGEHLVRRLREEGRAVRVLARTLTERTDRLIELGAEVVRGDLLDRGSLVTALAGVDLAYFTSWESRTLTGAMRRAGGWSLRFHRLGVMLDR